MEGRGSESTRGRRRKIPPGARPWTNERMVSESDETRILHVLDNSLPHDVFAAYHALLQSNASHRDPLLHPTTFEVQTHTLTLHNQTLHNQTLQNQTLQNQTLRDTSLRDRNPHGVILQNQNLHNSTLQNPIPCNSNLHDPISLDQTSHNMMPLDVATHTFIPQNQTLHNTVLYDPVSLNSASLNAPPQNPNLCIPPLYSTTPQNLISHNQTSASDSAAYDFNLHNPTSCGDAAGYNGGGAHDVATPEDTATMRAAADYARLLRIRRRLRVRKALRENGKAPFDLDSELYMVLYHMKKKPSSLRDLLRERKVGRPPKSKIEPLKAAEFGQYSPYGNQIYMDQTASIIGTYGGASMIEARGEAVDSSLNSQQMLENTTLVSLPSSNAEMDASHTLAFPIQGQMQRQEDTIKSQALPTMTTIPVVDRIGDQDVTESSKDDFPLPNYSATHSTSQHYPSTQTKLASPAANSSITSETSAQSFYLDRYQVKKAEKTPQLPSLISFLPKMATSFRILFMGSWDLEMNSPFASPYTMRQLPPFIYRDYETKTNQMSLLEEVLLRIKISHIPAHLLLSTIDYCYFRHFHLAQVNRLLATVFWPGIDMSEALEYPDYTVVVCYKKLVIGCGLISPTGYISYVAVHPQWRRSGIATQILYFLIRTCPNRDITLHVSANNDALILYQKFGFKVEQYVVGYYERYYSNDSPECKNAFFLRLRR
eukprot:TRINITY_DN3602_c0_g1_i3.p1 TRINITY_DN3602_c0_g1~~TRINITY_DN3602_c0_g1_i3.p1  ORF type:complete len:712 (+),score=93.38 TRINITY_DN3602_c0_g1_i3:79-2214(+)